MKKIARSSKKFLSFLRKRWYIVIVVLLIGGGIFYNINAQNAKKKEPTYTVKRQTLKETAKYSGSVDANEKITLRF